jgi:sec-independent protein translocase protein TatB
MLPLPSGFEWIVILVIALLILGPGKLPDVAAAVGKSIREFRKASSEVADAVKVDATPLPAGPGQVTQASQSDAAQPAPAPAATPAPTGGDKTQPTPQTSSEPQPSLPIAPVAPAAAAMPPVVTAPEEPQPVPDAAPTDVAPKSDG